jgi:hypothetical protein
MSLQTTHTTLANSGAVECPRWEIESFTGRQVDVPVEPRQVERDGSFGGDENLVVGMAMGAISVGRSVRPLARGESFGR